MLRPWSFFVVLITLIVALPSYAQDVFVYDFEQGDDLALYDNLVFSGIEATVVAGGPDGAGHCLKYANTAPSTQAPLRINREMILEKNLTLSFDHRETIEDGKSASYLGILFYDSAGKQFFGSDKFSDEWKHAVVPVGTLHSPNEGTLELHKVLSSLHLYARSEGTTKASMTVWIDNIRLSMTIPESKLMENVYKSNANPPLLNWGPRESSGRLQYSQDPTFPEAATVTVECEHNFYTPPAPIAPGRWYWRVWTSSELSERWSDIEQIEIVPEAHKFVTPPIPVADITSRPRPWLTPLRELSDSERQQLISEAQELIRQGVPEDPPPFVEGNPDWPTWIDWYGKVHGKITSATGARLQKLGTIYALTREKSFLADMKRLVFEAATWDPEGGSSMRNGDIGAHHLLRGLNLCYDALHDDLTEAERAKLRDVIAVRAKQFWGSANPFPKGGTSEFNNHAWLRAFGLAESGLVLLGEYPDAEVWAEYVRQLYIGKFLCALGYQGDNNEGISYWGYGLWYVIDYADMIKNVCKIDLFQHPWLYQTARFPLYTVPPGAWAVSFADTGKPNHSVKGPAQTTHVRSLAERTGDPYALWYSGATAPVNGVSPKPPVDLPQSILYKFIGWAVHNTSIVDGREGVTFAMHSGPFYAGHQHEDQNSFVINAYGDKLAIDSGYYDWYGSPHFNEYSTLTRAHNAILVDGEDQHSRKTGADGRIAKWFDSPAYGYTCGDASDPDMYNEKLQKWDRRALFIKPGFVVISDVLRSTAESASYDWLLHAVAPIFTDPDSQSFAFTSDKSALMGRFITPADVNLKVVEGFPVEPVDGYSTRPVPEDRYIKEWTLHATPAKPRKDENILAAMQIQRLADAPANATFEPLAVENGSGVVITLPDETHLVMFRDTDAEDEISAKSFRTDGECASIMLDALGRNARLCAIDATYIEYAGDRILSTTAPADFSLYTAGKAEIFNISAQTDLSVHFPTIADRETIYVDGERFAQGAASEVGHTIDLTEGEHVIAAGRGAARLPNSPLRPLKIADTSLLGYSHTLPDGVLNYWWGPISIDAGDRYNFTIEGWDGGASPNITIDGTTLPLTITDGCLQAGTWLEAGAHWLTITGRGNIQGMQLIRQDVAAEAATMLPADFSPADGSIIIEAEKPSAESDIKGLIGEKIAASGGLGNLSWDWPGMWAEWIFNVPATGDYYLYVRGASVYTTIVRAINIDGKPLSPKVGVARFKSTGGWCRTTNDWRYFLIAGNDGKGVPITLTQGTHTLRMEQIGGSMNLDLFAWEPVR